MGMTVKVKMNLDFPILPDQDDLMEIAKKVIMPDIEGRMNSGIDINGSSYGALDSKTIKAKQKRGLQTVPLIASGQLRRSPKASKFGSNAVVIMPSGMRYAVGSEKIMSNQELGNILQNKGERTKHGKRFFEFFGISREAEDQAIKMIDVFIERAIKRGGRKTVR